MKAGKKVMCVGQPHAMHLVVMHHLLSLLLPRRRSILSLLLPLKRKSFDSFLQGLVSSIRGGHSLSEAAALLYLQRTTFILFFSLSSEASDESLIGN